MGDLMERWRNEDNLEKRNEILDELVQNNIVPSIEEYMLDYLEFNSL